MTPEQVWQRARTEEQKEIRRQSILQAAYTLFDELEYDEISLNGIARQAGISKPVVYLYYSTREEIFLQLFLEVYENLADELEQTFSRLTPQSDDQTLARTWVGVLLGKPQFLRLIPQLMPSMERNASETGLKDFKLEHLRITRRMNQALQRLRPAYDEALAYQAVKYIHTLVAGLAPGTQDTPVLQRVLASDPAFRMYAFDLEERLTRWLKLLLQDLNCQSID